MSDEALDGWTRAAMVVGGVARREDAILLVHERTLGGEGPDQWVLPGGRVEPGELLDAAVSREVEEETGLGVRSVGSLAFGTQHYAPGRSQPLLFLAFHVELDAGSQDRFEPHDPDGLIIEARLCLSFRRSIWCWLPAYSLVLNPSLISCAGPLVSRSSGCGT